MLKWLRLRMWREQKKIIYQNLSASDGALSGYFSDNDIVQEALRGFSKRTRHLAALATGFDLLPPSAVSELLAINKKLRQPYDTTASRHIENFDKATEPLGGWPFYFERRIADLED